MVTPASLNVCLLASGSGGNATVIESGDTRVLVDAGLSARELTHRAAAAGYDLSAFSALILSHEHGDHIRGVGPVARRFGLPVYASRGTLRAGEQRLGKLPEVRTFAVGEPITVGSLRVEPYSVPHDVADGCGFIFAIDSGVRLGWAMDLGSVTTLVREKLRGCQGLVLEFNHDEDLVRSGPRPWPVKQRVLSDHGHLSNEVAAGLLSDVAHAGLEHVIVAHISQDHNTPARPRELIAQALGPGLAKLPGVTVAAQHEPTPIVRLRPACTDTRSPA